MGKCKLRAAFIDRHPAAWFASCPLGGHASQTKCNVMLVPATGGVIPGSFLGAEGVLFILCRCAGEFERVGCH